MSYLLDTGYLYALLNKRDRYHDAVQKVAVRIVGPIFLPTVVTTEVAYLVQRDLGQESLAQFTDIIAGGRFPLLEPITSDFVRAAELLRKYGDSGVDFVDAVVVAIAERYRITNILTVDQRHFRLFRPKHCHSFELFP